MGSITSTPKLPAVQQQPVYVQVPVPVYTSAPAPVSAPPSTAATSPSSSAGGTVAFGGSSSSSSPPPVAVPTASQSNLLQRSRGVFSTVLTGFRGLLGDSILAAPRKTLLGE